MLKDLVLTKGQGQQYDFETQQRIKSQQFQFNYEVAERARLLSIIESQRLADMRQKQIFQKVESIETRSKEINYNFADKISKIIPYQLIPIIPIAVAFLVLTRKK